MLPPGLLGKRILMVSGCILGLLASFIGVLSTDAVNTRKFKIPNTPQIPYFINGIF